MQTEPRVGCGAAIVRDGRILLLRRAKPPEAETWSLPGGKIDLWEGVEDAVRREVLEETGLRLKTLRLLCVVDHITREEGQHWIAPTYACADFEGEAELLEPQKHHELAWFALDALPTPASQAARAAARALADGRFSQPSVSQP